MKRKNLALFLAAAVTAGTIFSPIGSVDVQAATWQKNNTGWWWQEDNGTWPANEWKVINGAKYSFDQRGYMRTGWYWDGNNWYYLGTANDGAMKIGWQKVNGKWYWLEADGKMATGWVKQGNKKYYLDASGAMRTGWLKDGNNWYYLGTANDGAMKTGWQKVNGIWYYMYEDGKMAANTWIGSYYVDGSGAWRKTAQPAQWIKSGNRWWYRHTDGGYTKNDWETINGKKYHFDSAGWMQTGWQQINGIWYYLGGAGDGAMKISQWIGNYYVGSDGKMATNTWIDNYYVGADGAWVPDKKKPSVPLEKVIINGHEGLQYVGDECDLALTAYPENASVDGALWTSSDPNVITVDQRGHVKAVGPGKAEITVAIGDIAYSIKSSIYKPIELESIEFYNERYYNDKWSKDPKALTVSTRNAIWIYIKDFFRFKPQIDETTEKLKLENWSFTFSDPSIVSLEDIDWKNGALKFRGLKAGETEVTVTVSNKTTTFKLVVIEVDE